MQHGDTEARRAGEGEGVKGEGPRPRCLHPVQGDAQLFAFEAIGSPHSGQRSWLRLRS
jgi:hypothetical protein